MTPAASRAPGAPDVDAPQSVDVQSAVPPRSEGLLVAPFGEGCAVYDLVTDRVHILDGVASWLLAGASSPVAELVAEAVEATGAPSGRIEADIVAGIGSLAELGLLGRSRLWVGPETTNVGMHDHPGGHRSAVHRVLDAGLVFHGVDPTLLADFDACLGLAVDGLDATVAFDVESEPDGRVRVHALQVWEFADRRTALAQLPGLVQDWASHRSTMLVLHSGGVRTPDGRVLLMPGLPEVGKSTLTAALVIAGCDHLGDELVGVRRDGLEAVGMPGPLVLDETSRRVLGIDGQVTTVAVHASELAGSVRSLNGDAGPVGGVVMPLFDPSVDEPVVERLDLVGALQALLTATMNLALAGDVAWATMCRLAESVPVVRLRHGDALRVAREIAADPEWI